MTTVGLVGSTGLVGSHLLTTLLSHPSISSIHAFTRKPLPTQEEKLHPIQETNSTTWPSRLPSDLAIFFSALGTTARQAGSFANQRKIDYDLNLSLAETAKKNGTRIYVLISTAGADPKSMIPYSKMKGELDEAVKGIGFEHVIVLKPGLLVGKREDSRPGEFMGRSVASLLGRVSGNRLMDPWAQEAEVVARAAVAAALEAVEGRNAEKVRVLKQGDVVRLGRTEWSSDDGKT